MKPTFSFLFFLFCAIGAYSQDDSHDHDEHGHSHEKHDHFHNNEIGISLAPTFFSGEREQAVYLGFHGHYVKRLGETRFGAGLGVEYIFDESKHQTYSLVLQYSPTYRLHLVAAPGVAVEEGEHAHDEHAHEEEGEEEAHEVVFAIHIEAVYEFELGPIDMGPVIEFAYDEHDVHYSLGVHIAFPF